MLFVECKHLEYVSNREKEIKGEARVVPVVGLAA